jgi:hypothetical protein
MCYEGVQKGGLVSFLVSLVEYIIHVIFFGRWTLVEMNTYAGSLNTRKVLGRAASIRGNYRV